MGGYKSIQPVCAFYENRGQCYKGAYCRELHPRRAPELKFVSFMACTFRCTTFCL